MSGRFNGQAPRRARARREDAPGGRASRSVDKARGQTEADFLAQVVAALRACGWLVYHTHDSRNSESGFPDVVALKGSHVLVAELKVERGQVDTAVGRYLAGERGLSQEEWLEAWRKAGAEVRVWKPGDWPEIERVATGG